MRQERNGNVNPHNNANADGADEHPPPEDPVSATYDENDINVFRKVHFSACLSRGRSIVDVLYDRSIHGPRGVGGVRSSLEKQKAAMKSQGYLPSPSSVMHEGPTSSGGDGSGVKKTRDNEHDSLSDVLGGRSDGSRGSNDSLSEVLNGGEDQDEGGNRGNQQPPANRPSVDPRHHDIHDHHHLLGEDVGYKYNFRTKMNSYPTSLSREIVNFVEQHSITKFKADYLSLDTIKPVRVPPLPRERQDSYRRREDADETEYAVSTISIAFSPDGRTVASTHGDHTVKISCCNTGTLIRSLEGHPRTPWTVKYHPTKSNIVASGCLGYQVRLWDWNQPKGDGGSSNIDEDDDDSKYNYHERKAVCLKMIRLRNSIISLSFHPTGSVLAIASGHSLHLWVYDSGATRTNQNEVGGEGTASIANGSDATNSTNAIAGSQQDNAAPGQNVNNGGNGNNNGNQTSTQTVLHQIRYANNLRCVHFPPGGDTIIIGGVNSQPDTTNGGGETNYSLLLLDFDLNVALMSPNEFNYFQSIDPADRRPKPRVEVLKNYRTFLPRALLYNDGGFDVSRDGRTLCGCAELWLPFGVDSAAELIEKEEKERIAVMEHSFHAPTSPNATSPPRNERKKRKDMDSSSMDVSSQSQASEGCPYHSPPRQGTLPPVGDCRTPPNPSRPDPTSPPSPPGRRWVSQLDRIGNRQRNGRASENRSLPPTKSKSRQQMSGRYVPHVVVVSLDNEDGTLGKVLEATPLGSKATSVTCVKFSPSAEFCLLGYGVREQGQNSFGLPFHPVNALYRIRGGMTQVATMLSGDDDVNIARFHPESGVGFVYGTKQGRVRVLGPRPWNYYYD